LIQINVCSASRRDLPRNKNRGREMPSDVAMIVAAIVAAFVIFAIVLAWADRRTRNLGR
jgi:hypothetical protein